MFAVIFQLLLTLIVLCLSVLYIFLQRNYEYWKERGIRFEKPRALFENLFDFERKNMWIYMYNLMKKHKTEYVGIFLGWKPALVINSKELAERILVRDSDAFQLRYKSPDPKKGGEMTLFTTKNLKWKEIRQELELMFMKKHYQAFMKLMDFYSILLVKRIQRDHIDNNQPVNLKELFSLYPSNSVYFTIFGRRLFMLKYLMVSFSSFICKNFQWTSWKIFKFIKIFFSITLSKILRLKSVLTRVDQKEDKIELEFLTLCLLIQGNKHLFAGDNTPDLLIQIRGAVVMVKAIQTSSTTLCYCVHELAYHPDKQEKLFKEIRHALGDRHNDSLGYNDLLELSYLSACINETLRKYPTLAFLDRMCNKPYKLTEEVIIEPGTPVFLNVLAIQYNEEYYSEPYDWYPERFMIKADNDSHDYTFLPFGEGPRSCLGKDYGMMRIRTALAHMVLAFRFEPGEAYIMETDPDTEVLSPKSGGKVKFIPR